jgi:hypothetical protein
VAEQAPRQGFDIRHEQVDLIPTEALFHGPLLGSHKVFDDTPFAQCQQASSADCIL